MKSHQFSVNNCLEYTVKCTWKIFNERIIRLNIVIMAPFNVWLWKQYNDLYVSNVSALFRRSVWVLLTVSVRKTVDNRLKTIDFLGVARDR